MIKAGIIGLGRIGKLHARNIFNFVKELKIKALSDINLNDSIINDLEKDGIREVNFFDDWTKITRDKEIDVVFICSPTHTHSEIAIDAAINKKHIFCEKPIHFDIEEINKIIRVVEENNVKFQVGFNRRFDHNFSSLKNAIDKNLVGKIHLIKITSRDPELPSLEYIKNSGGIFLDMTIHDFDMLRFLSNSEVNEILALGDVFIDENIKDLDDIDTANIFLKLENGVNVIIDNSREAVYGYDQRVEVFGSSGMLKIENDYPSTLNLYSKDAVIEEKPLYFFLERYEKSYINEVVSFVNSVKNNTATKVSIYDGLKSVLIAHAAKKSFKNKSFIKL